MLNSGGVRHESTLGSADRRAILKFDLVIYIPQILISKL